MSDEEQPPGHRLGRRRHVPTLEEILALGRIGIAGIGRRGRWPGSWPTGKDLEFTDDIRLLARTEAAAFALMDPGSRLPTESLVAVLQAGSDANRPILSMTPRPGLSPDQVGESSTVLAAGPLPRPIPRSARVIGPSTLGCRQRLRPALRRFDRDLRAVLRRGNPRDAALRRVRPALQWFGFPATIRRRSRRPSPPRRPCRKARRSSSWPRIPMAGRLRSRSAPWGVGSTDRRPSPARADACRWPTAASTGLGPEGEGLDFEPPSEPRSGRLSRGGRRVMLAEIDGSWPTARSRTPSISSPRARRARCHGARGDRASGRARVARLGPPDAGTVSSSSLDRSQPASDPGDLHGDVLLSVARLRAAFPCDACTSRW